MIWGPLPAFGHPPLRGEGSGEQSGHLAPLPLQGRGWGRGPDILSPCHQKEDKERLTMPEAVIVSAVRTPIGRAGKGALRTVRADDLAAVALRAAAERVPNLDTS